MNFIAIKNSKKINIEWINYLLSSIPGVTPKIWIGTTEHESIANAQVIIASNCQEICQHIPKNELIILLKPDEEFLEIPKTWTPGRFQIVYNDIIIKEPRVWINGETTDSKKIVASVVGVNKETDPITLEKLKDKEPMNSNVYYELACWYLQNNKFELFETNANHFLFLEKNNHVEITMMYYYLAMVKMGQKNANEALRYLAACLAINIYMAEFWCLIGDVHYYIIKDFRKALQFYQNAIFLGSKRKNDDAFPVQISKYRKYPTNMIEKCEVIINTAKSIILSVQE